MLFTTTSSAANSLPFKKHFLLISYCIVFFIIWMATYINTPDRTNWYTENVLTVITLLMLFFTYRLFRFSDLSYTLFFLYLLLHIYGAEYTYAENPLGYWLSDVFNTKRNYYDRIVHCSFGLLMTYPMREYFRNHFHWPRWVCWVLPVEITLSFSGMYELIEWAVADIFFPHEGVAYLGSQGDVWDAQKDMTLAVLGAIVAMVVISILKRIFNPTPAKAVLSNLSSYE